MQQRLETLSKHLNSIEQFTVSLTNPSANSQQDFSQLFIALEKFEFLQHREDVRNKKFGEIIKICHQLALLPKDTNKKVSPKEFFELLQSNADAIQHGISLSTIKTSQNNVSTPTAATISPTSMYTLLNDAYKNTSSYVYTAITDFLDEPSTPQKSIQEKQTETQKNLMLQKELLNKALELLGMQEHIIKINITQIKHSAKIVKRTIKKYHVMEQEEAAKKAIRQQEQEIEARTERMKQYGMSSVAFAAGATLVSMSAALQFSPEFAVLIGIHFSPIALAILAIAGGLVAVAAIHRVVRTCHSKHETIGSASACLPVIKRSLAFNFKLFGCGPDQVSSTATSTTETPPVVENDNSQTCTSRLTHRVASICGY